MPTVALRVFDDARQYLGGADFLANNMRLIALNSSIALTDATPLPHLGGTGTTNLATAEISGGNWPANGLLLGGKTVTGDPNTIMAAANPAQIAQDNANPNNLRYLALVDDTDPEKKVWGNADYVTDRICRRVRTTSRPPTV